MPQPARVQEGAAVSSTPIPPPDTPVEPTTSAIGESVLPVAKRPNRAPAAAVDRVEGAEQLMANLGLKPVAFVKSGTTPTSEAPSDEPTMQARDEALVFDRTIDSEHDGGGPG